MALLLTIDTATELASVCLSQNGNPLAMEESHEQKNHGSFLQPAIKRIFSSVHLPLSSLDAIAVTEGPGSYTGLRVGMASAKGLCYALGKPLIMLGTLEVMAHAAIAEIPKSQTPNPNLLVCPMIDARRMEVFTAMYDINLAPVLAPSAVILTEDSFLSELTNHVILFSGNGSGKFQQILPHPNALFVHINCRAFDMVALAEKAFEQKRFADLAYSQPFYLKEFFSPAPKH